jgi:hypothetical protein
LIFRDNGKLRRKLTSKNLKIRRKPVQRMSTNVKMYPREVSSFTGNKSQDGERMEKETSFGTIDKLLPSFNDLELGRAHSRFQQIKGRILPGTMSKRMLLSNKKILSDDGVLLKHDSSGKPRYSFYKYRVRISFS